MTEKPPVLSDEKLEGVYQEEYKRAIKFSEKYGTVLSAKNYNPNRPADRQRTFNTSHRDTVARAIAQAQRDDTWQKAQAIIREIFEEIKTFYKKPSYYHYVCWASGMALVIDKWGEVPTYECHCYNGDFNCGYRGCKSGTIVGDLELQDFQRHQNSMLDDILRSLKDKLLKGD